jgi:hypothetical protein
LNKLAQTLIDIKNIEIVKRDRTTGKNKKTETQEERRLRIRQEQRGGGGAEQLIQAEDEDLNVGQAE